MNLLASFLFARPSFTEGWGRIGDFGNFLNQYNCSQSGAEPDKMALAVDWSLVEEDIRGGLISALGQELAEIGRAEQGEQRTERSTEADSGATCAAF